MGSNEGLNRGTWTGYEDELLREYVRNHGEGKWAKIHKQTCLKRTGKSCRLRWLNYLRPTIKRGNITPDEEDLIIRLHNLLGNRWSLIAGRIPGRTDNEIKNYWNSFLKKKSKENMSSNSQQKNNEITTTDIVHKNTMVEETVALTGQAKPDDKFFLTNFDYDDASWDLLVDAGGFTLSDFLQTNFSQQNVECANDWFLPL